MFIYALTAAISRRPDLDGIELPSIYEIHPHLFFDARVIRNAQKFKMRGMFGTTKETRSKRETVGVFHAVIPANYTGWYMTANAEQTEPLVRAFTPPPPGLIDYFTGDIGLNAWYYNLQFNLEPTCRHNRKGELYLFHHQQLLARYEMERQCNRLKAISELSFNATLDEGFFPNQNYYNGDPLPLRRANYNVANGFNFNNIKEVESYERHLEAAIDVGYFNKSNHDLVFLRKPESIEELVKLVQAFPVGNEKFIGFMDMYTKILIGTSPVPNAMQQLEMKLRDPVFYKANKRMLNFYWKFMDNLPAYKCEETSFPGVNIVCSTVTNLTTYLDETDSDITNAVDVEVYAEGTTNKVLGRVAHYEDEDFIIKARSSRLNSIPFSYTLTINAKKSVKGVVRAFIGPKFDDSGNVLCINENRKKFVLLDVYSTSFKKGINSVTRNSNDFALFVQDRTTSFDLYQQVTLALNTNMKYKLHKSEAPTGYPDRLKLPKGTVNGWPCQIFFVVTETKCDKSSSERGSSESKERHSLDLDELRYGNIDSLPLGFPLDRNIDERNWFTSNMVYHDTIITHRN